MDSFQGNMEAIMEYLQAQKATTSSNHVIVVVTNVTVVTTTIVVVVVETQLRLWFNRL